MNGKGLGGNLRETVVISARKTLKGMRLNENEENLLQGKGLAGTRADSMEEYSTKVMASQVTVPYKYHSNGGG
jgi:hypothetical protein